MTPETVRAKIVPLPTNPPSFMLTAFMEGAATLGETDVEIRVLK